MKKIVFLDRSTFPKRILIPKLKFKNKWKNYAFTEQNQIVKRIRDANVIVTNKTKLTQNELKEARFLELIAITATGTNIIDINFCRKNNIKLCNLQNYASTSVAEHVFTLALNLIKQIKGLENDINTEIWQRKKVFALLDRSIEDLNGKTIGIIGKGAIGKQVAKISKAFNMKVNFFSVRGYKRSNFKKFLSNCDILTIHCPLENNTINLISTNELKLMKKSSIIINTARGGIINEKDLVNALRKKLIAGAGIDVATTEPPKKNHPYYSIIDNSNFIWTPHTAWASNATLNNAVHQLIDNINSFYRNRPKNLV
jgi:glycerate dehydrogenase